MAKRLLLGSVFFAGLAGVALWSQSHVAAQYSPETTASKALVSEVKDVRSERKVETEAFIGSRRAGSKQTVVREVPVIENGVVRKVFEEIAVKDVPKATKIAADSSNASLQETYLELHSRIAERLTPEQLAEKCKALEKELSEIVAEEEIEIIRKQLFELKRKSGDNKGISTRLERAIEALGKYAPAEAFKSL